MQSDDAEEIVPAPAPAPAPADAAGGSVGAVKQEPWDYDRFVETYNRIVLHRGGWLYEANGRTPEEMRQRYLRSPATFTDLYVFAEGLVIWEQGLNL
jgi:hypothetical protein